LSALNDLFSSKIKIIQVLRRANGPLIMHHVAKRSRLSVQLVNYHVEQMLDWGIIVASTNEDKTVYTLQEAYYEDQLLEDLLDTIIPYMEKMSQNMDFSQIKVPETEAVIRNLFMLLRLFQTEIEKRPYNKKTPIKDSLRSP
jgi:predicted transcriptional regulator